MNCRIIFGFLLFFGCYRVDLDKINIPVIEDIPKSLNDFENDYSINDFWGPDKDSSLFYLLNEFNLNNDITWIGSAKLGFPVLRYEQVLVPGIVANKAQLRLRG